MATSFRNIDDAITFLRSNRHRERGTMNFPEIGSFLGKTKDDRALEPLIETIDMGGTYMRSHAAIGLGLLGDRRAIPSLIAHFSSDPDLYVRGDCAIALGQLMAEEALPLFENRFEHEHFEVQKRIITALAHYSTAQSGAVCRAVECLIRRMTTSETARQHLLAQLEVEAAEASR